MENKTDISIVIPVYNEEESIELLYKKLKNEMEKLNNTYEILLIDDGSKDKTPLLLDKLHEKDKNVKIIHFRKNFGQTAAIAAGFKYSAGEIIITMDSDLQNDPVDIPRLIDKINEGFDVVSGWREKRKDKFLTRRLPSILANKLISKITGVKLKDYGCTLKAYKREVVKNIKLYGEMHRFIPAIANMIGIQVAEIPVEHHPRQFGTSKYGISRTIRVILDLITVKFLLTYSANPMQMFGKIGFLFIGIGFLTGLTSLMLVIFKGWTIANSITTIGIISLFFASQFFVIGLVGEINVRIYYESQGKEPFYIKSAKGISIEKDNQ